MRHFIRNQFANPASTRLGRIFLLLITISGAAARADLTTNLFPVADTALRNATPDLSFGTVSSLPVGVSGSGTIVNHGLFKFPIAFIPTNATVTQATLQLASTVSNPNTQTTANYDVFRLLKDWDETDTTWNTRLAPAISWATPGGQAGVDFISTPSGTAPISPSTLSGPSLSQFSTAEILADIELWRANPGTNFGWILRAQNDLAGSGKQIASREDAVNSPVLVVQYTLPAPPIVLLNPAIVNGQMRFSFEAAAAQAYEVQFNHSLTNSNWEFLEFISAPPTNSLINITTPVQGEHRFFRVVLANLAPT